MANIQISDLYPTGSELFMDDENFMNELTDTEVNNTQGGITPTGWIIATYITKITSAIE